MSSQTKSLQRIVALQRQMYRICEWEAVRLSGEAQALRTAREDALAALNNDAHLQGLFVPEMARQLARIDTQYKKRQDELIQIRLKALDEARRLKAAEVMLNDARRLDEEQRRKAQLADIIEQDVMRHQGASFP